MSSSDPRPAELQSAAATLAWALEILGVTKFGIIGGVAVSILSTQHGLPERQTNDIDLIIQPTNTMSADLVSQSLTTNEAVKEHFVSLKRDYVDKPHFIVKRSSGPIYIPIEIFDCEVWPDRRQYYNLDLDGNSRQTLLIKDKRTLVLRQKIMAYAQRQNKASSDMDDISTLGSLLELTGESISITEESDIEALKTVLAGPHAPDLEEVVRCEASWPDA